MQTNLLGNFLQMKYEIPLMIASGGGWALVGAVALAIGGTVAYRFLAARRGDAEEVLPAAE